MQKKKLALEKRVETGKKLAQIRKAGLIPSVVYGGDKAPELFKSEYVSTEKVLREVGYHSTVELELAGKTQLAIVKDVQIDPVSRKIINVEFQAVSANEAIEATTPISLEGFEISEANKLHYVILQSMEEIEVKAKPADLPEKLVVDVSGMKELSDKITVADLVLPKGVELADKELSQDQVIANLYDPAAEAAAREAAEKAAAEAAAEKAAEVGEGGEAAAGEAAAEEKPAEGGEEKAE